MPSQAFTFTGTAPIVDQPASEKLVVFSTSDSDTTQTVTITGIAAGSPTTETVTLNGTLPAVTTNEFSEIYFVALSSTLVGELQINGSGTPGVGSMFFGAVPTPGSTVRLGFFGHTTTYTWASPARYSYTCVALASLVQGDYLDITVDGVDNRFWFSLDGTNTSAPSNPGTLSKVDLSASGPSASDVAGNLRVAIGDAIIGVSATDSGVETYVTRITFGTLTVTENVANAGFIVNTIHGGTADAANLLRTNWNADGTAMTADDAATTMNVAINASGSAGIEYGTGTVAHPYLSATYVGGYVTLTDRVPAVRILAWDQAATGGVPVIADPTGGSNGNLLLAIPTGELRAFNAVELNTEDLATDTLPPLFTGASDWIAIESQPLLQFKSENFTNAVTARYETSVDQINASTGLTTIPSIDNNPVVTPLRVNCEENKISSIRLVITANANTDAVKLSAVVVY